MRNLTDIADAVRRGERINQSDALVLWRDAPLWLLGELATERKRSVSGQRVYYNRNVHIEPSNICLFNCEFCSFRRREGDPDAWYMTLEDIEERARQLKGSDITEVHIVGGVHPKHDLDTYSAMIRRIKSQLPHVTVKAYTAVEIFYMIRREGVSVVEGLRRLTEAGMECIPGGGAEIFDAELRAKICPDKCSAEEWLAVHRAAHNMDIPTNCTMLYGHIESLEQRIDHLERLRKLQDEAPGFDAFIPLKYRSQHNRMSAIGECSVEDDLRMIAMSRIYLDNIPHIKAYWVAYGKATTEMALQFGADDIDGTIGDSTKIYSMAGGMERPSMSVEELEAMVRDAGYTPVERDSHYNEVERAIIDEEAEVDEVLEVATEEATQTEEATTEAKESTEAEVLDVNTEERGAEVVEPAVEQDSGDSKDKSPEPSPQPESVVAPPTHDTSTPVTTEQPKAESVKQPIEDKSSMATQTKSDKPSVAKSTPRSQSKASAKPKSPKKSGEGFMARYWSFIKRFYGRFPIISHMILIGLFGLLLLGTLYFGLRWGTRHGDTIRVPDLVGTTIEDARRVASDRDLEIVVRDSIFDVDLPGGTIVDQLPRTSEIRDVTVKPGRKIYVTINAFNRREISVPYVAKQTLRQALNQLERAGMTIEQLVYEPDMTSTDYVLHQIVDGVEIQPSTDMRVPVGTGVTLHVSYRREEQQTLVPRLVGLSLAQAKSALWDNGLNVGDIVYDESVGDVIERRTARVYEQSRALGVGARRGSEVTIRLSCNDELVDSLRVVADAEYARREAERRREEERRRAEAEAAEE